MTHPGVLPSTSSVEEENISSERSSFVESRSENKSLRGSVSAKRDCATDEEAAVTLGSDSVTGIRSDPDAFIDITPPNSSHCHEESSTFAIQRHGVSQSVICPICAATISDSDSDKTVNFDRAVNSHIDECLNRTALAAGSGTASSTELTRSTGIGSKRKNDFGSRPADNVSKRTKLQKSIKTYFATND